MKKASTTIILLIQLVISSITLANVWTVDLNGSGDYSDIQSALGSASNGDTIIVNEGVYRGDTNTNLNFQGKAITLKSSKGSSKTIIDCFSPPDIYGQETMSSTVFGALVIGVSRNPSLKDELFKLAIFGFALTEAIALFSLMMGFLILFAL